MAALSPSWRRTSSTRGGGGGGGAAGRRCGGLAGGSGAGAAGLAGAGAGRAAGLAGAGAGRAAGLVAAGGATSATAGLRSDGSAAATMPGPSRASASASSCCRWVGAGCWLRQPCSGGCTPGEPAQHPPGSLSPQAPAPARPPAPPAATPSPARPPPPPAPRRRAAACRWRSWAARAGGLRAQGRAGDAQRCVRRSIARRQSQQAAPTTPARPAAHPAAGRRWAGPRARAARAALAAAGA